MDGDVGEAQSLMIMSSAICAVLTCLAEGRAGGGRGPRGEMEHLGGVRETAMIDPPATVSGLAPTAPQ
eukprot:COSAG01_NODE_1552_length_9933_cov_13.631483_15_plen_68_part_00